MPKYAQEHLLLLTRDEEFQRRIKSDDELNAAFRERDIDRSDELAETLIALGGGYTAGAMSFLPPSPAVLSMLWLSRSPFVLGGQPSERDVDGALLILTMRREAFAAISDIDGEYLKASAGLCDRLGVRLDEACDAIAVAMRHASAAFRWFPDEPSPHDKASEPVEYGAEWLTRIIACVSQVSRYTPDQIKWEVSMLECGYLVLQNARRNGVKNISRKTRAGDAMRRMHQLMDQRLSELGVCRI